MEGISFSKKEESFTVGVSLRTLGLILVFLFVTFGVALTNTSPNQTSATDQGEAVSPDVQTEPADNSGGGISSTTDPIRTGADSVVNVQGQLCDNDPPYWYEHFPFAGSVDVSHFTRNIKFKLRDDVSGVDLSTLHLNIDGIDVYENSEGLVLSGNSRYYIVTYQFPAEHRLSWGDTIWIKISACDLWKPANCMQDSVYFVVEEDDVAPVIIPEYPKDMDTDVPINSHIRFQITDEKSGIDFNTLTIKRNGNPIQAEFISGDVHQARFVFNAPEDSLFGFNESNEIQVTVEDSAGNPARLTYTFQTVQEHYAPVVEFIYPQKNSDQVILGTDSFIFQVTDLHSGVDFEKTEFIIELDNGTNVEFNVLATEPIAPNGFRYTIKPTEALHHNDVGKLLVIAFDNAGNQVQDFTSFKVLQDFEPPVINLLAPETLVDVPTDHEIRIQIEDAISGVDLSTIVLTVNGQKLSDYLITGDAASYQLSLPFSSAWNSVVTIEVYAADIAGNDTSVTFDYEIVKDNDAPIIRLIAPQETTDVDPLHQISLEITDALSGVNHESIFIVVNNDSISDYQIDGNPNQYLINFNHTAEWNGSVQLEVSATDFAERRTTQQYNYQIREDKNKPTITLVSPLNNSEVDHPTQNIILDISDDISGVNSSTIEIFVDQKKVEDFTISGDLLKYTCNFEYQAPWDSVVSIEVQASDFARNQETASFLYNTPHPGEMQIRLLLPETRVDVTPQHEIKFAVSGSRAGIDQSQIKLLINNQPLSGLDFETNPNEVIGSVLHFAPWNSNINLKIIARDFAGFTKSEEFEYQILTDVTGPIITRILPTNLIDLDPVVEMKYEIRDDVSGVNSASVTLTINGNKVPIQVTPEPDGSFSFTHSDTFLYNSIAMVAVEASDNAGNKSQTLLERYIFQADEEPPIVEAITPLPGDTAVALDAPIVFTARDTLAGVDISSLNLVVRDIPIALTDVRYVTIDDTLVTFSYKPKQPFLLEDSVWVKIAIKDKAENSAIARDLEYGFKTIEDYEKPFVSIIEPDSNATGIELDAPIVFEVSDSLTGINAASLLLRINGQEVSPELTPIDPKSYRVTFTPSPIFTYNDTVEVFVYVEDNSKNKNHSELAYQYFIVRDDTPPAFTDFFPAIDATGVPCRTPIHLVISDAQSGVDSSRFNLWIDTRLIPRNQMQIKGDSTQYIVDFQPPVTFYPGQVVLVKMVAFDFAGNDSTFEYGFTIDSNVDETAPLITPITPAENDTNIAINTGFSLLARDDESGIDIGSARFSLKWKDLEREFTQPDSIYLLQGGTEVQFFYNISADTLFQYNEGEISASFSVSDLACDQNHGEKVYSFVIEKDNTKPEIILLKPDNLAAVVPNTPFQFEIGDNETGLQIDQIKLMINNVEVQPTLGHLKKNWVTVLFNETEDRLFEYGSQVPVMITALNGVGLDSVLTFDMQIVEDQTNPLIVFETPQEVRPPRNPEIVFQLIDQESGINLENTSLKIDETRTGMVEINGIDLNGTERYSVEPINGNFAYRVRYNPDSTLIFDYFQEITITISTENHSKLDAYRSATLVEKFKVVDGDTLPPWITNGIPAPGDADVAPTTTIAFDVLDSTGVDLDALYLSLNNVSLGTEISYQLTEKSAIVSQRYSGYHIVATPDSGIGFNDTVSVKIWAVDVEQNEMADTLVYQFYSQRDDNGPEIVAFSPQGLKVELKPHFKIQISDSLSGVDTSTIVFAFKIRGETEWNFIDKKCYEMGVKEIRSNSLFEYSFFLEDSLAYDTYYELFVRAADNEGNYGSEHWEIKTRKFDEDPPWIEFVDPLPDVELPFCQSTFTFKLGDDLSFVVKERIVVDISADTGGPDGAQELREWHFAYADGLMEITEEKNYLMVTLTPPADDPFRFYFNDKVEMEVFAIDAYENDSTFQAVFYTQKDDGAPYLVSSVPEDKSTNNLLDTAIKLELADDLSGILLSTVRVKILDRSMFEGKPDSAAWVNAPLLYPGLMQKIFPGSGMKAAAKVELNMPAGSMKFDYNRTIWLQIYAEDDVERLPNKLDTVICFGSEQRLSDLFVTADFPQRKYSVGDTVKITATVSNQFAAVAEVFDITFSFEEDEEIRDTVLVQPIFNAPDGQSYEGSLPLNAQGKFKIVVTVDKENSVMEQNENNNDCFLTIEVEGGQLEVKSNPFTPNGDGINDEAYFNCEQFQLADPTIKIFDLRGRFIKALTRNDLVGKKFKWDGRDKNGNEVMPGVFLYILQDKGNAIKNGCVVVAR